MNKDYLFANEYNSCKFPEKFNLANSAGSGVVLGYKLDYEVKVNEHGEKYVKTKRVLDPTRDVNLKKYMLSQINELNEVIPGNMKNAVPFSEEPLGQLLSSIGLDPNSKETLHLLKNCQDVALKLRSYAIKNDKCFDENGQFSEAAISKYINEHVAEIFRKEMEMSKQKVKMKEKEVDASQAVADGPQNSETVDKKVG